MASTGVGSSPHVTGELFGQMAGLKLDVVHYGGGGPALKAMIEGQAQMMFEPMSASTGTGAERQAPRHRSDHGAALGGAARRGDGGGSRAGL